LRFLKVHSAAGLQRYIWIFIIQKSKSSSKSVSHLAILIAAGEEYALISPHTNEIIKHVDARKVWQKILEMRLATGEPYMVFSDSCLSSINAQMYDQWKDVPGFIEDIMRFLDNVLESFIQDAPDHMNDAKYSAMRERSVGLGLMGFHSMLQSKGIPFESALAKSWNMRLFSKIRGDADKASVVLAEERGPCPDAADMGVMERFSHKMAVAPTASISIIREITGN